MCFFFQVINTWCSKKHFHLSIYFFFIYNLKILTLCKYFIFLLLYIFDPNDYVCPLKTLSFKLFFQCGQCGSIISSQHINKAKISIKICEKLITLELLIYCWYICLIYSRHNMLTSCIMYIHMSRVYANCIGNSLTKIQFVQMWYTNCDS